ncbi:MAG: hypothetical protein KGQ49_01660 [Verrucomicrobia bacterium]|nr:hypothetical protein [Verrucomicrobiota bacterium]MBU6446088.1 hypothetical protein [Verrucomicrobiota bacterium]MDE3047381.1 hypothetical protein [Verrucomicrobiota bacterium]
MLKWVVFIYGLLIFGLGWIGYFKGGSLVSLVMGVVFGALLIVSALLLFSGRRVGFYSAFILTILLTATFTIRYLSTHKELPAILAVLSAATFLYLLIGTLQKVPTK